MSQHPSLIAVVGPTAAGKSDFAQELAVQHGGEIINIDSQQFYRGFDIGTGKVPLNERKVKHWLLDVCEPGELMTAMEFVRQAEERIAKLQSSKKVPILVGGTGLYLKGLLEGLDQLPGRDSEIRKRLQNEIEQYGIEKLHHRLSEVDPVSAKKISPQDPVRLIRYLEIFQITQQPPSKLMRQERPSELRYSTHTYWISPPRDLLRGRIEERVKKMIASGWLEEVRQLLKNGVQIQNLENKPIGYAELSDVVIGKATLEEVFSKIVLRTQQYAKRQETFFRGMLKHPAYNQAGSYLEILTQPLGKTADNNEEG